MRRLPASGSVARRATSRMLSVSPQHDARPLDHRSPTAVSMMWRGLRSTSSTPSSRSSFLIWVDSVGWLTKQASAARPKWRWSATATR